MDFRLEAVVQGRVLIRIDVYTDLHIIGRSHMRLFFASTIHIAMVTMPCIGSEDYVLGLSSLQGGDLENIALHLLESLCL